MRGMPAVLSPSRVRLPGFRDPVAAEAWDACFRWREHGRVRDVTVAATWERVVAALAREAAGHDTFARDLQDALTWLRLLPDPRLLVALGTGRPIDPAACAVVVLNAAAFVRDPFGQRARLDLAGVEHAAGLAVRLLDRARAQAAGTPARAPVLRIGLIGVSDALQRLGLAYDSGAGREEAVRIAAGLAHGALEASLAAVAAGAPAVPRAAAARAMAAELRYRGGAHAALTAIERHPELALLADNVGDAVDPIDGQPRAYRIASPAGERVVRSAGGTDALRRELGAPAIAAGWPPASAQLALRAAIAPWIDAPIDYPLATAQADATVHLRCLQTD